MTNDLDKDGNSAVLTVSSDAAPMRQTNHMMPKITVIQPGSRRRYFIPKLFQRERLLGTFATDFTTRSPFWRFLKGVGLINRIDPGEIPPGKTVCANTFLFLLALLKAHFRQGDRIRHYLEVNRLIARELQKRGLGDTRVLYCVTTEFADYLEWLRETGSDVKIICDPCIHPRVYRVLKRLSEEFADWPSRGITDQDIFAKENPFYRSAAAADVLLCPSEWVAEGVREMAPAQAHKIQICPYGTSIDYGGRVNNPMRGRFFWAGRDAVGKGLPYLALAADKLKPRYPDMDFRIAGITDKRIQQMPECRNLHFLGRLTTAQMREEFLTADAFVFPTLCEALAGVLLESIAAGCPVITTRCAGLEIENGVNGIVIPEHNVEAITEAIERVYTDRAYRTALSSNCIDLAKQYCMETWGRRLISLVSELLS